MEIKNYHLKSKTEFSKFLQDVEKEKLELLKLPKNSPKYKNKLTKIIEATLFAQGNSYCLDNEKERKKITKVIVNLLYQINLLAT